MSTLRILALISVSAATVAAQSPPQGPQPDRGRRAPGPPAAQTLLGRSAELELTDAQVVKLAAIARRSEARRRAMRASMDSAGGRLAQSSDSIARRQFGERMRADMQRAEEQIRVDQRDAIALLTPDQQAKAWSMVADRGARIGGERGLRRSRGPRPGRIGRERPGELGRPFRQELRRREMRPLRRLEDGARIQRPLRLETETGE